MSKLGEPLTNVAMTTTTSITGSTIIEPPINVTTNENQIDATSKKDITKRKRKQLTNE